MDILRKGAVWFSPAPSRGQRLVIYLKQRSNINQVFTWDLELRNLRDFPWQWELKLKGSKSVRRPFKLKIWVNNNNKKKNVWQREDCGSVCQLSRIPGLSWSPALACSSHVQGAPIWQQPVCLVFPDSSVLHLQLLHSTESPFWFC